VPEHQPPQQPERRSGATAKPEDLPTVFQQKAMKPMDRLSKIAAKGMAVVLFVLVVGTFIRTHFMGPPHLPSEEHKLMQTAMEWAPLLVVSSLSIALFVWPEVVVKTILRGAHKAIEVAPGLISQLRIFRKDRRAQ